MSTIADKQNNSKFNQIKHLRQFYQPQQELFIDAQQLPQFFQTNLIDDLRVVKYFPNDPQANIKIFYYQYLKLCFEIDNVDYESYIEKIYQLIRTQGFQFYFDNNDPQKQVKNAQYKSLLIDFFQLMNTSSMTIDNVLRDYPILNDVFTNFFRTVVMIASIAPTYQSYIDKNQLFDFLSSFFSVDISSYDKCLKFVQSDIFVYEEDQQNIYMAYIAEEPEDGGLDEKQEGSKRGSKLLLNQMKTVKEDEYESEVSATNTDENQQPQIAIRITQHTATNSNLIPSTDHNNAQSTAKNSLKPRARTIIKQSYIESQFADYTSFSNNISSFGKNVSAQHEKQVFVESLQPNSTVNETEQGNNKEKQQNFNNEQVKKQELIRVKSEEGSLLYLNANRADNIQIEISRPLYNKVQQQQQHETQLTKATSHPEFLYRQKSLHQLAQSCYQSLDSNLQPQLNESQINQQNSQSQKSLLQERSGSKLIGSGQDKVVKKGLVSLGLQQQQGHMYVSYQEPTKDVGFVMESDLTSMCVEEVIPEQSARKLSYKNQNLLNNDQKPSLKSIHSIQSHQSTHKVTNNEPLFHNPITSTTKPSFQQQLLSFPNSRMAQSANSQKEYFYNPTAAINNNIKLSTNLPTPSSQRLKLNVTKQFTNSIVMKSMSQPYKTQTFRTRQRARQFRKNIYQQFIYTSGENNMNNQYYNINEFNKNSNIKKPSSRTSIPSQSTLKTTSIKNIPQQQSQQSSSSRTNLITQQTYNKQQSIYPVSMMVKQQQNRVYESSSSPGAMMSNQYSNFKIDNFNYTQLSKISEIKQISEVISSHSRQSIENTNKSNQRQINSIVQQTQSKVSVSIYNPGAIQTNNIINAKLPTYTPVLKGQQPQLYQQQSIYNLSQKPTQPQQPHFQLNNYTVHTVMPHNNHHNHTPNNNTNTLQKTATNYNNYSTLDTAGKRTFPQGLMSVIPQTQKPLPLYVPFERRK